MTKYIIDYFSKLELFIRQLSNINISQWNIENSHTIVATHSQRQQR